MESLRRITLVDQAEAALREALREGRFGERLPGMRPLAEALAVNALTVGEAVSRLVADGTLVSEGPRKKFRIARHGRGGKSATRRKVLYLTAEPMHEMKPVALEILSLLLLERPDWDVKHRAIGRSEGRTDRRRWDGLLKSEEARHLVYFGGHPAFAKWSLARGVPTVFLGGDTAREPVPMLGVNAALMIEQVMEKLIALGHTRICHPICGMPEGFSERQRRSMGKCLEAHGLPFVPNYHAPIVPKLDPDEFTRALAEVFKVRRPTALVVFDWEHFITASCMLREMGLKIPRDVSVAILSPDRHMAWHRPQIAHFRYPVGPIVKTLTKWIEAPPEDLRVSISLPLELFEADSLGRASKG
ncbi:substrate-binding domain-containing protein [Haloferula sp. BvORR071]|uniref:GntR family transcriptional regulator n=1 Tax=Haloferula sp. BvORR071 TaxID=1396141 RepID=UPI00054FECA4|nr:substrate-binding domain-containing protein [Haloferula sp. BvORR071]